MSAEEKQFIENCALLGERVLSWKKVLVVHHHDCDGIASAGVAANGLRKNSVEFETFVLKRLDGQGVAKAAAKASSMQANLLFSDLGSGQLTLIEPLLEKFEVAVIDHHVPQKQLEHANFVQANPHLHGFDGGTVACSASTAYFCFRNFCPGLSPLGVVGAVGDMQDANGLVELNELMVGEGVASGFVSRKMDLKLFGRHSRDLVSFTAYSSEPFLPGLTGNQKGCARFLEDSGIPLQREGKWLRYKDLSQEEKKKLDAALQPRLL